MDSHNSRIMTFKEFQMSRRPSEDLEEAIQDSSYSGIRGLVYEENLIIEDQHPKTPRWSLIIAGVETESDDLEELESKLYQWAVSEGYFHFHGEPVGYLDSEFKFLCPKCAEGYPTGIDVRHNSTPVYRVNIGIYSQVCAKCKRLVIDGVKKSIGGGPLCLFDKGV